MMVSKESNRPGKEVFEYTLANKPMDERPADVVLKVELLLDGGRLNG